MADQARLNRGSGTAIISRPCMQNNSVTSTNTTIEKLNKDAHDRLRYDTYQEWLKSKNEELFRKQEEEKKLKAMAEDQEKMKKESAKMSFKLWKHKKDQEKKVNKRKERELKEKEEFEKRLQQQISKERVTEWMKSTKHKPRPVPSNMGLIRRTTTKRPSFFNPHPWMDPV